MGDFVYVMNKLEDGRTVGAHSIDIIMEDGTKYNTWSDFYLAPSARPTVAPPQVKTEYVNVPGADGALDYTEVLTGKPRYSNRTGQWQFIMENGHFNWPTVMSQLLNTFHGKKCQVVLTDDPDYYYKGRIQVQPNFSNKDYPVVVFTYNFEPYKLPVGSQGVRNWKWAELFGNVILYGSFSVNGAKTHNLLNETNTTVDATVNVSNNMRVYRCESEADIDIILSNNFKEKTSQILYTGDNTVTLYAGQNIMIFRGNGIVTVSYERGGSL